MFDCVLTPPYFAPRVMNRASHLQNNFLRKQLFKTCEQKNKKVHPRRVYNLMQVSQTENSLLDHTCSYLCCNKELSTFCMWSIFSIFKSDHIMKNVMHVRSQDYILTVLDSDSEVECSDMTVWPDLPNHMDRSVTRMINADEVPQIPQMMTW